jgi:hypothetical protein
LLQSPLEFPNLSFGLFFGWMDALLVFYFKHHTVYLKRNDGKLKAFATSYRKNEKLVIFSFFVFFVSSNFQTERCENDAFAKAVFVGSIFTLH